MNPPPNDNHPHSELDILEGMFNHMFNGTMTMLFKSLQDPSFVEIIDPQQQSNSNHSTITDLDGSDFKRIAQKRRQKISEHNDEENDDKQATVPIDNSNHHQREQINDNPLSNNYQLHNVISIFNRDQQLETNNNVHHDLFSLLFGTSNQPNNDSTTFNDTQNNGWTFSSSSMSSHRQIHPDGTEETTTTTKKNGITETVTRIKYPDGSIEETKHVGGGEGRNSNYNSFINSSGLLASSSSPSSYPSPNNDPTTTTTNPISRFFKSIWG
ncbi:hypothetical protein BJ944DRAFT_248436 [Cunninghamella echinulata]|nr:hypothetical protein BJ944DRAFT_248436 [Cunninghamella echinulata]